MRPVLTLLACVALTACSGGGSLGSLGSGSGGSLGSIGSLGSLGSLGLGGGPKVAGAAPRAALPPLIPQGRQVVVSDRRVMAGTVTGAELTPTAGGALLRVSGTPQVAGAFNAELVKAGREGTTLILDLRMNAQPGGRIEPGQITVARQLTQTDLAGIRTITIRAAGNSRSIRR